MTRREDHGAVRRTGAVAVAALGVALGVGFVWNFLIELRELSVVAPPLAVVLVGVALSGALAYAGARWMRDAYTIAEARRVAAWCYGGAVGAGLLVVFTDTVRVAEGRPLAEPQLDVLVAVAGGALAGLVAGHQNALAHRQVGEAERARDSMAFLNRTLRHEVLNGVQLISGYATTVREHTGDDAERAVDTIIETSEDLHELIDDVGRVAEVHAGTADLRPVDLVDVLAAETDRLASAYSDATVHVDTPEEATVRADDTVVHVFRNLLTNAVEHNDGKPTVWVTVDVGPEVVSVEVADDGPGVPDDQKADLFDPDAGGTRGFGLHLVRTLVEGYGGAVTVRNNEPTGAVFSVDLPRPDTPGTGVLNGGQGDPLGRRPGETDDEADVSAASVSASGPGVDG